MSELTDTSSGNKTPEKKISNSQFQKLIDMGVDIPEEIKSRLISEGVVVSRTREKTRRGWLMEDGSKVFPSLSFKGLNGKIATEEMENFRSLYYDLLTDNVEVVNGISL